MDSPLAAALPSISERSRVRLRPLYVRAPEHPGGDWIVGHEPSDSTIALPEVGVAAIRLLSAGTSIDATHDTLLREWNEDIDVADFVAELGQAGLVASIDEYSLGEVRTIGQGWLSRLPSAWFAWLYSIPAVGTAGAIVLAGFTALLLDAQIRPQASDLLWSPSYTIDAWTLVFVSWALILKHELGHLLTARGRGLAAELTIDRRLIYLVVVSRIAGIWKLPQRERLYIYSAGMLSDALAASVLALVLAAAGRGALHLDPSLGSLFRLLIIMELAGITWQFEIFLKTDVYHIFADMTGRHDLPERARALLAAWCGQALDRLRLLLRPDRAGESWHWAGGADGLTTGYTLLVFIGITGSLIFFLLYLLPATGSAVSGELHLLAGGLDKGRPLEVLDGLVSLALEIVFYGLLVRFITRDLRAWYRRRRATARQVTRELPAGALLGQMPQEEEPSDAHV